MPRRLARSAVGLCAAFTNCLGKSAIAIRRTYYKLFKKALLYFDHWKFSFLLTVYLPEKESQAAVDT
jgi:hypothetical protein